MKILVLNGSPKGKNSVTLQTVLYLQKHFKDDQFEIINVGQQIKKFEKNFQVLKATIEKADFLLFAYPVYTFLAPYQLHRFIELLKNQNIDFTNKFAAQISTSKHFYDVTAHKYIMENCSDLGLSYIYGLFADMDDLLTKKGQQDALDFWNYVHFCVTNNIVVKPKDTSKTSSTAYSPRLPNCTKQDRYDTIILTNSKDDLNLDNMINDFQNVYPYPTRIINIADYPFSGGCLGCFNCATDGKCVYNDKFDIFLRENIQKADAIVYAFTIKDHSMGASFKLYHDRQFCNGHRATTVGMPIGYLVNGNLDCETNVRTVIEARGEVGHNFLCGIATTTEDIVNLSQKLVYVLQNKILLPQNFYGVGGKKIFRDLIYLMRGLMKADHKFYKKQGVYDFPQKQKFYMLKIKLLGHIMAIPAIKKQMNGKMNEYMIAPYKKVLDKES